MNARLALVRILASFTTLLFGAVMLHGQSQYAGTYLGTLYNTNAAGENVWLGIAQAEFTVENDGTFTVTNQLSGRVAADGSVTFTQPGVGLSTGQVADNRMTAVTNVATHDPYTLRFDAPKVADLLPMWEVSNLTNQFPTSVAGASVAFGNGMFMVLAPRFGTVQGWVLLVSTNGLDWSKHVYDLNIGAADPARTYASGLYYANGKFWFSIVGDDGGGPNMILYNTENGDSLGGVAFGAKFGNLKDMIHANGKLIGLVDQLGGQTVQLLTSDDGAGWSLTTLPESLSGTPSGLAFAGGKYFIGMSSPTNFLSTDLANWVSVPFAGGNQQFGPRALATGNGRILGGGNDLVLSTDGETWTAPSPGAGGLLPVMTFSDGFFYGLTGGAASLYRSTDGNVWRKLVRPSTNTTFYFVERMAVGNGRAIVSAQGVFLTAPVSSGEGLSVGQPPMITSQPADQTRAACSSAFISAGVGTGGMATTVQWYKDGVVVANGTEVTLSLDVLTEALAGGYYLVANNALGSVTSRVAQLTVSGTAAAPQITLQPISQAVLLGSDVTLRVTATGPTPRTYIWSTNGVPVGPNSPNFTITGFTAAHAGDYRVRVQNGCGFEDSQVATLSVMLPPVAPTIVESPTNRTVNLGASTEFTVQATGTQPLAYQWEKNGDPIPTATGPTYTLTDVKSLDAGQYRCVVTNVAGTATSGTATLTVAAGDLAPVSVAGHRISVQVTGVPTSDLLELADTTFQYYFVSGLVLSGNYTYAQLSPTTGRLVLTATAPPEEAGAVDDILLTFTQATQGNFEDTYTPVVGSPETIPGTFIVDPTTPAVAPTIVLDPVNRDLNAGDTLNLFAQADGTVPLVYQWQRNSTNLPGKTTGFLQITGVTTADAGQYWCVITNTAGSVTSAVVTVTISGPAVAPVITLPPQSKTVIAGSSVTLTVEASGTAPFTYEWFHNESRISDATNATLTLREVDSTDAGNYTVRVSNSAGFKLSDPAVLTINTVAISGAPDPSFMLHPTNLVTAIAAMPDGKIVALAMGTTLYRLNHDGSLDTSFNAGLGPRQISAGVNLPPIIIPPSTNAGSIYAIRATADGKLLVGGVFNDFNGQTKSALVRLNSDGSLDTTFDLGAGFTKSGGQGTVTRLFVLPGGKIIAFGDFNNYQGNARQLGVVRLNPDGSFDSTFVDTTGVVGVISAVSLMDDGRIVLAGANPSLKAQVFRLNANGGLDTSFAPPGAGSSSATVGPLPAALPDGRILVSGGGTNYNGVIVNPALYRLLADGTVDTSYPGLTLRLSNVGGYVGAFLVQPDGRCYIQGGFDHVDGQPRSGLARLLADGTLDPSFVPPAAVGFTPTTLPVMQGNTLLAAGSTVGGAGVVYGVFRLTTGDAAPAGNAPAISVHPESQSVLTGFTVTLRVEATGTAPLSYQWRKGTDNIPNATNDTLVIGPAALTDAGQYRCVVSNSIGSATSNPAVVEVGTAPVAPSIVVPPMSQTLVAGQPLQLTVEASGTAPLSYQWQIGTANIEGATSDFFGIPHAQVSDSGNYRVVVTNVAGTATSAVAVITVNPAPVAPAILQGPTNTVVVLGQTAVFSVSASGTAPLSYQWQRNGTNISGATSATLSLNNVAVSAAGFYRVVVTNVAGSAQSAEAMLTVLTPPAITEHPFNLTVVAGAPASFQVSATGSAPLHYQWQRNGTNLPSATAASYTLAVASTNDAGTYRVVVSNGAGTVTSAAAVLVVNLPAARNLTVLVAPTNAPGQVNARVSFSAQGNETSVSFSLRFNTNALSLPLITLLAAPPPAGAVPGGKAKELPAGSTLTTNYSEVAQGSIGVTVTAPSGSTIPAGEQPLVDVSWTLAEGQSASASGLTFGDSPVPQGATDVQGTPVPVSSSVLPVEAPMTVDSTPSGQTGLFGQIVNVSNPGSSALAGVRVLIKGLGNDLNGNAIRVFNATGTATNNIPYIEYGPLGPGGSVPLTVEYYVSDRRTTPTPIFEIQTLAALPTVPTEGLSVVFDNPQRPEKPSLLEFPTTAGRYYLIQYSADLTNWVSSLPTLRGTGARVQWLDNGPPRTQTHPTNTPSRYYRVLLSN